MKSQKLIIALSLAILSLTLFGLSNGVDDDCDGIAGLAENIEAVALDYKKRLIPA